MYKTSYDKYTTMLQHVEGLRQMYDKTQFTTNHRTASSTHAVNI